MTKRFHHEVACALLAILLMSNASPALSAEPPNSGVTPHVTARPAMSGPGAPPSGLVALLDTSDLQNPLWQSAVSNPYVSGVALQIRWSDIEPTKGEPNWSQLDEFFAAAQSSKKWVHLLIFPGFFSPEWAKKGAQTDQFPVQYGPGQGTIMTLPMPWDPVYLNNYLTFVKQVSDRYGTSPALKVVAADGPTSVSAEFTLPKSPEDVKKWQADGYTPTKFIGAWKQVFQTYAADFPNQYISASAGASDLNINDKGKLAAGEPARTRQAIVDEGMKLLGSRFVLQMSDVHAGPGPNGKDSSDENQFLIGYIGSTVTGFQLGTNAKNNSAFMGSAGNPPLALNMSINLALQANGAGQHVNYVEVHSQDVLDAQMQSVLRYADEAFTKHGPFVPRVLY
jgi:hypothetical protein